MRFGSPLLRRVDGWVMGAALVGLAADVSYGHVHDGDGQVLPYAAARESQEELRSLHLSASECFRSSSARCQRASVLADEVERGRNAAWALGLGAVAAASATVLLWWFWEVDEPVVVGIGPSFEHVKVSWTHAF